MISGAADFTVSPSATAGETISFFGFHTATIQGGGSSTSTTPVMELTVATPPSADLGVSLNATAAGL